MTRAVLLLFVVLATPRSDPVPSFPVTDQSRLGAPHEIGLAEDLVSGLGWSSGAPFPSVAFPRDLGQPALSGVSVSGLASWYRYRPGQAAAGPALRRWLGATWRGTAVRVCATACTIVRLTDWMRADRLVDLDRASFAQLANPAVGLVRVTITQPGPTPTGPPIDTEGGTP